MKIDPPIKYVLYEVPESFSFFNLFSFDMPHLVFVSCFCINSSFLGFFYARSGKIRSMIGNSVGVVF